ncbi:MAG: uncharacterized protein HW421_1254 [Ignavibacteria bacterium]|nr:uncharacterized protein [Ignavibacteria bacterium]
MEFDNIIGFEWDEHNINKNWIKHSVLFTECEEVFFNQPLLTGIDDKHSISESRYYGLGKTSSGRLLFVVFTIRNDKIRIISARDMKKNERKIYETHTQI